MDPVSGNKKSSTYWRARSSPILKNIFGRWWWLAMPLLGIVCAEAYVGPHVADTENEINRILKFKSDRLQQLGAEYQTADNELFAVEATIDTFFAPELEWHGRVLDSLRTVRHDIESAFPLLQSQIENLTGQLQALEDPVREAAAERDTKNQEIQRHRENIAALRDSLAGLEREQEALTDRLDRLQNPDKYDRSRALISPGR